MIFLFLLILSTFKAFYTKGLLFSSKDPKLNKVRIIKNCTKKSMRSMWIGLRLLLKHLNKIKDFFFDHLLVMLVVNIIHSCIYSKDFHSFISIDPVLMSFMDSFKIVKSDVLFSFSISDFDSWMADLWRAFQVDYTLDWTMLDKSVTDWVIDFIFVRLKVAIFVHDLSKDKSIS